MPNRPVSEEEAFEEFDYAEYWIEEYQRLSGKGDHPGMIRLCQQRWERDPQDLHALEALAYAHLESGDPDTAIRLVETHYRQHPEHPLFQAVILDALLSQGKGIDGFDWVLPPRVVLLDSKLLDWLYRFLKLKRKPRVLSDLWLEVHGRGHPFFSEAQLLADLSADSRFELHQHDLMGLSEVSVRRS